MAELDGKRQWGRECKGCEKSDFEGKRYTCNLITLCEDCYQKRDSLTFATRYADKTVVVRHQAILKFNLPWRERDGYLADKWNDVFAAARVGAYHYVKQQVEEGKVKPNDQDYARFTLVQRAVYSGSIPLVKFLLEKGGQLDFPYTDCHAAYVARSLEMLTFLEEYEKGTQKWKRTEDTYEEYDIADTWGYFKKPAEVKWFQDRGMLNLKPSNSRRQPLIYSAINIETAKAFIEAGADVKEVDSGGDNIACKAVAYSNFDLLKFYVEQGVDPCLKRSDGSTCLINALGGYGALDMIKYLVEKGCDLVIKPSANITGYNLLPLAMESGDISIIQYLIDQGLSVTKKINNEDPVHLAGTLVYSSNFAIEILKLLEKHGLDLKSRDWSRRTYLHHVLYNNDIEFTTELLDFLVEKGMEITDEDNYGTAILTLRGNHTAQMKLDWLLKKGANIRDVSKTNQNMLHVIASFSSKLFLKLFHNECKDLEWLTDHSNEDPMFIALSIRDKGLKKTKAMFERFPDYDVKKTNRNGSNLLMFASVHCPADLELLQFLLDKGIDINYRDNNGINVLHHMGPTATLPVVKFLVERGADVKALNNQNETILWSCIGSQGDLLWDTFRYLLDQGANLNQVNKSGETILFSVVRLGNLNFLKWLVEEKGLDPKVVSSSENYARGETLLGPALACGRPETVKYLINKGVDINQPDSNGTPVFLTPVLSNMKFLKLVEGLGANLKAKDSNGNTLLHTLASGYSLSPDFETLFDYLIDEKGLDLNELNDEGSNCLSQSFYGYGQIREKLPTYLINKGAKFNHTGSYTLPPLFQAANTGSLEVLKTMLARGANIEEVDYEQKTVIFYAVQSGNMELLKYLVEEKKLDPKVKDNYGNTLLMSATDYCVNPNEMVKYLLEQGLDPKLKNQQDRTAIYGAVRRTDIDTVKLLFDAGCPIATTDQSGMTPLYDAISQGGVEMVKFLIDHGCDVRVRDNWSMRSAVWRVVNIGNDEDRIIQLYELFIKSGVNLGAELDSDDNNLLWSAVECSMSPRIIDYLVEHDVNPLHVNRSGQNVMWACNLGSPQGFTLAKHLISKHKVDIQQKDTQGNTVLFRVMDYAPLPAEVLEFLFAQGLDVNHKNEDGRTPFWNVLERISDWNRGELEANLKLFLKQGADVTIKLEDREQSILTLALRAGCLDIAKLCVEKGMIVANETKGWSAVISSGQKEVVEWFVAQGASLSQKEEYGTLMTPLCLAATHGRPDMIKLLLSLGADPNETSENGYTPMMYVVSNYYNNKPLEMLPLLKEKMTPEALKASPPECRSILQCLAGGWNTDTMPIYKWLFENLEDVGINLPNSYSGDTALHQAARGDGQGVDLEFVELLLKNGASKEETNMDGQTPYMMAMLYKQTALLDLLSSKKDADAYEFKKKENQKKQVKRTQYDSDEENDVREVMMRRIEVMREIEEIGEKEENEEKEEKEKNEDMEKENEKGDTKEDMRDVEE